MADRFMDDDDFGEALKTAVQKTFDPSEARDEHGRWTEGGSTSHAFVSPNVEHAMNLSEAGEAIHGPRQRAFMEAADDVNQSLGLSGKDHAVLGAWADGAENSSMLEADGKDYERLKLATVMKGHLANQRAVLVFKDDPNGAAALYRATLSAKPADLHASLLKHGIDFHTLIPHGDKTEVVVADLDGTKAKGLIAFAEEHDAQFKRYRGAGEFIGGPDDVPDAESRAEARKAYEGVIAGASSDSGRDPGRIWQGIRDRWSERLAGLKKRGGARLLNDVMEDRRP